MTWLGEQLLSFKQVVFILVGGNTFQRIKFLLLPGILALFLGLFLTACGSDETPSPPTQPPPSATAPVPTVAEPSPTALPPPTTVGLTPTPADVDPVSTLPPVPTVPIASPPPTLAGSPSAAGFYGPLPTPPRTLDPKAEAWATGPKTFPKVQFVVGTSNGLYLLDKTGQAEKLIAGGAAYLDPHVAPDGSFVAVYRTDRTSKQRQLVLVDPTGAVKLVTLDNGGMILAAAWSPDSHTLALTRATDTNNDGITDSYDATTVVLYDPATGKGQPIGDGGYAAWSPDGVRIAYLLPAPNADTLDPSTRQLGRGPNGLAVYNLTNKGKRDLVQAKGLQVTLGGAAVAPLRPDQKFDLRYFKAVAWHSDSVHITASADLTGPNGARTGVIVTMTLENATPKVITAGGDAANRLGWSADGKHLAFETQPQYPVGPKSAAGIALVEVGNLDTPTPVKTSLGNPATRSEVRDPLWIDGGQSLAYLEGDRSILSVADLNGQTPRHLISDCTGFDWL